MPNSVQDKTDVSDILTALESPDSQKAAEAFQHLEEFLQAACASLREDNWRISYVLCYLKRGWNVFGEYAGGVDFIPWAESVTGYSRSAIYRAVQLAEVFFFSPVGADVVSRVGGIEEFCAQVPQAKAAIAAPVLIQDAEKVPEVAEALKDPYVSAGDMAAFLDPAQFPSYDEETRTITGPDGTPWFTVLDPPPAILATVLRVLNIQRQQYQSRTRQLTSPARAEPDLLQLPSP